MRFLALPTIASMHDDSPYCPTCLTSLTVEGTLEHPYWFCPTCRVACVTAIAVAQPVADSEPEVFHK